VGFPLSFGANAVINILTWVLGVKSNKSLFLHLALWTYISLVVSLLLVY